MCDQSEFNEFNLAPEKVFLEVLDSCHYCILIKGKITWTFKYDFSNKDIKDDIQ